MLTMLRFLTDRANFITAVGITASGIALYLTVAGRPELAIAVALWAMLADHLDGIVAKRMVNRPPDAARMGKSLDGFSDLLYGSVIPALVLIQINNLNTFSLIVALVLILAGALRLSYFSNFGMSGGCFTGVPLSYDIPVLAVLLLIQGWLPPQHFGSIASACMLVLAVLHVSPFAVPGMNRAMYVAITVFAVLASATLAYRALPYSQVA